MVRPHQLLLVHGAQLLIIKNSISVLPHTTLALPNISQRISRMGSKRPKYLAKFIKLAELTYTTLASYIDDILVHKKKGKRKRILRKFNKSFC